MRSRKIADKKEKQVLRKTISFATIGILVPRIRSGIGAMSARGLPHVLVGNIAQQGIAFVGVIVLAKLLSPSDFALVRISMAYAAVVIVIAAGGLTAPVLRYCADHTFPTEDRRGFLGVGLRRLGVVSFVVVTVALIIVLLIKRSTVESRVLACYAIQIPGLAAASLLLVYFQAVQRFKFLACYQVSIRVASFVITSLLAYYFGLNGFLTGTVLVVYLTCLPLINASRPNARFERQKLPRDFFRLAHFSLIGVLITTVGQYADLMILDWVNADKRQVAVYSLATIYFFAASALAGSVQSIATPAFTALLYHPQDFAALLRRWSIMLSFSAILMAIPLVGLAFAMEHWILGPAYAGLAAIVMVLMARFCLWCTYAVGGAAMVGMGAIKQGMWIAAVTSTLSVAIGYPLCVRYGIWGATWTQVIVAVASAVLVWWFITVEMRKYQARGSVASYLHS